MELIVVILRSPSKRLCVENLGIKRGKIFLVEMFFFMKGPTALVCTKILIVYQNINIALEKMSFNRQAFMHVNDLYILMLV